MQVLLNKEGQKIVCSHALASMGYGLPGAIGMSLAYPDRRVIALEGDGGFAQNMQELGVIKAQQNNMKIFISSNRGYASIRNSQKAYFNGHYVGCDELTGLGFPNWSTLFDAYNIPVMVVNALNAFSVDFLDLFHQPGPSAFILDLDPEQEYFPKVGSRINNEGFMESSPLHLMNPPLTDDDYKKYLPHL
jgi:acetolactate synthase-1/2/3 large subunit